MAASSGLSSQASIFLNLMPETPFTITPFEKEALTCEEVEKITGLRQECLGKAMVVNVDKKPMIALLPGNMRLNIGAIKTLFSARKASLIHRDMLEEITGLKTGSITPLLHLIRRDIPIVMDESLQSHSIINISSGDPKFGINISPSDLIKLVEPTIATISTL